MYADDNQLFIYIVTFEYSTKISHLPATVDLASLWMSSNLFSLNQFKTEFLLICLPDYPCVANGGKYPQSTLCCVTFLSEEM